MRYPRNFALIVRGLPPFILRRTQQEKTWGKFVEQKLTNGKTLLYLVKGRHKVKPWLSNEEREERKQRSRKRIYDTLKTKGVSVKETEGASEKQLKTANYKRIRHLIRSARICKHASAIWLMKRKSPWL